MMSLIMQFGNGVQDINYQRIKIKLKSLQTKNGSVFKRLPIWGNDGTRRHSALKKLWPLRRAGAEPVSPTSSYIIIEHLLNSNFQQPSFLLSRV